MWSSILLGGPYRFQATIFSVTVRTLFSQQMRSKMLFKLICMTVYMAVSCNGSAHFRGLSSVPAFSASDEYVNFGNMLIELAIASRHMDSNFPENPFRYRGPLSFDDELAVERVKIEYSKKLRRSFRSKYPEQASSSMLTPDEEDLRLPYYLSSDIARFLTAEGYNAPLSSAWLASDRPTGEEELTLHRRLFDFPITCSNGGCTTSFDCWGVSLAINGLNMEQSCNLLEKLQLIGSSSWTINDWLREIPSFIDAIKSVDGILGIISLSHCSGLSTSFSEYSIYGDQAVFYYPKALCNAQSHAEGCFGELYVILGLAINEPVRSILPESVVEILDQIQVVTYQAKRDIGLICVDLRRLGVLGGSLMTFLDSWESMFDIVDGGKTKFEFLLDLIDRISGWTLLNDYLPEIPRGCKTTLSTAVGNVYTSVFKSGSGNLPVEVCKHLNPPSVSACMVGLTENIDKVEWIASSIGNGNLHMLTEDLLPALCGAIGDMESLDAAKIFAQLPLILRVYKSLDLTMLEGVLPGVHTVLSSCGEEFAETAELLQQAVFVQGDLPSIFNIVCSSKIADNRCMLDLSDGLDKLSFASDVLGQGALRTIISKTVPGACEMTEKIYDFHSENPVLVDISSVVLILPDLINWYSDISNIQIFKDYIPVFPSDKCPSKMFENFSVELSRALVDTWKLPQTVCTLNTEETVECMLAIGLSLKNSELVSSMFSTQVSDSMDIHEMFTSLFQDLFPQVCQAISASGAISTTDIIRAFPTLLELVNKMDIIPFQSALPAVHKVLSDTTCSSRFQKLALWVADIIDGKDTDTVNKICRRLSLDKCLISLSRGIDTVSFLRDIVGVGSLELISQQILPSTCSAINSQTGTIGVENILEKLPDLLSLIGKLSGVSNGETGSSIKYPLAPYIPNIPSSKLCLNAFQDMGSHINDFAVTSRLSFSSFIGIVCSNWPNNGYLECIHQLGDSFDNVELITNQLGGKGLIQDFSDVLIPGVCSVLSPGSNFVDGTNDIVSALPTIIKWYKNLRPQAPAFITSYLPDFPDSECPESILTQFSQRMVSSYNNGSPDPNKVLASLCGISGEEKACIAAISDSIDDLPVLVSVLGTPKGSIKQMMNNDLEQVCTILGNEFKEITVENMLRKLPQLLTFVTSLRDHVPSFAVPYLPVIPHDYCDASYQIVSTTFADVIKTNGVNKIPSIICSSLDEKQVECVALLGDALDEVQIVREMIGRPGIVRYAMTTIRTLACDIFSQVDNLELSKLPSQLPLLFEVLSELNTYSILDPFLPDVPSSCSQSNLKASADSLQTELEKNRDSIETATISYMCTLSPATATCIRDLGVSIEQVQIISDIVPHASSITSDLLKLLPVVCGLLFSNGDIELSDPDQVLLHVPTIMSLLDALRDLDLVKPFLPTISDSCMSQFHTIGNDMATGGLNGLPGVLCGSILNSTECLVAVGKEVETMNVYKGMIPGGLIEQSVEMLPEACLAIKSLGNMDYQSIIVSIPHFLELMDQLNHIPVISNYIPVISTSCKTTFETSLVPRFEKETESGLPRAVCGITQEETVCIQTILQDTLEIPAIANLATSQLQIKSTDTLSAVVSTVFKTLPKICAVVSSLEENAGTMMIADNVLLMLPSVLDLYGELSEFKVFNLPAISTKCDASYRKFSASDIFKGTDLMLVPSRLCIVLYESPSISSCLIELGSDLDKMDFLDIQVEPLLELTLEHVVPKVCTLVPLLISEHGEILFENVFDIIPDVAEIYIDIQQGLPVFLQETLPPFPSTKCASMVLASIGMKLKAIVTDNSTDIPLFLCQKVDSEDKACLGALGDTIDTVPVLRDLLGRPGLLKELVGEPLSAVCNLLGYDNSDVGIFNLLGHFETFLYVINRANEIAPDFFQYFLPQVPQGVCVEGYSHISIMLSNFSIHNLCALEPVPDIECLGLLGDNIERVPVIADMLFQGELVETESSIIRSLANAIPDTVCKAFDDLGGIQFDNFLPQVPQVFQLLTDLRSYPMLRDYIPVIPEKCNNMQTIVDNIVTNGATTAMCQLTISDINCLIAFGENIEQVEWTASYVPDASGLVKSSLDIVPAMCEVLTSADGFNPSVLLRNLPLIYKLIMKFDGVALANGMYSYDIGNQCRSEVGAVMDRLSLANMDLIPATLCTSSASQFACMKRIGDNIEQLPGVTDIIPTKGLISNTITILNENVCPMLLSTASLNVTGFVLALPRLMLLIRQLEGIPFVQEYMPKVSNQAKDRISGSVTNKLLKGLNLIDEVGLLSIGMSLDFSGLTSIFCDFDDLDIAALKEFTNSIGDVPLLKSLLESTLPLDEHGETFTFSSMVDAAFRVQDSVCELLDELGKLDFNSFFLIAASAISIVDDLNQFPIIDAYVPEFGRTCVQAVQNISSYVTGPTPVNDLCSISVAETDCLLSIAKQLDGISEVKDMFMFMSESDASLVGTVELLVADILPGTCSVMLTIANGLEGSNMASLISNIPVFLNAMSKVAAVPFMKDMAPKLSNSCNNTLSSFGIVASKQVAEIQGVRLVCESSEEVRQCILELNNELEKVSFIGDHIADGMVQTFIDLIPVGCKLVQVNSRKTLNMTLFFQDDLPRLIIGVGKLAKVTDSCAVSISDNINSLCAIDSQCLVEYVSSMGGLPLIGKYIPVWASDVILDMCSAKNGNGLSNFFENTLAKIVGYFKTEVSENCVSPLSDLETQMTSGNSGPQVVCQYLDKVCMGEFVDQLTTTTSFLLPNGIPEGTTELLITSCEYFYGDTVDPLHPTINELLPHLPALFQVMSLFLGYPVDSCAIQLHTAADKMLPLQSWDTQSFCNNVNSLCVTKVVKSLRTLPFIGDQLPETTDQLVGATCAVFHDRASFSALLEHIPTLIDVIGRILLSGSIPLTSQCQAEIPSLFDKSHKFRIKKLCILESKCISELIETLQSLPMIGDYVPDSITNLLSDACAFDNKVIASGFINITEDTSNPDGYAGVLPDILILVGKIVATDATSEFRILNEEQTISCGNELTTYAESHSDGLSVETFCTLVSPSCVATAGATIEKMPFIQDLMRPRSGELIAAACTVFRYKNNPRQVVLETLPSMLLISSEMLDIGVSCKAALQHVGALFKSRGGELEGRELCAAMPDTNCLNNFATGLASIPFLGSYIPQDVSGLIRDSCELIEASQGDFYKFIHRQGTQMLHVMVTAAGVSRECATSLEGVESLSLKNICVVDGTCRNQLVAGLRTVPLVGEYLPRGMENLLDGVCEFTSSPTDWISFANRTLPQLLSVVGFATTEDDKCAYGLERFGAESMRNHKVVIFAMCQIEDYCFNNMVGNLTTLPLWGPFLPQETSSILVNICTHARVTMKETRLSSTWESIRYYLYSNLHVVFEFTQNLIHMPTDTCNAQFQATAVKLENQFKVFGEIEPVSALCLELAPSCLDEFVASSRKLPLVGQLIPQGTAALVNAACPLARVPPEKLIQNVFQPGGFMDQIPLLLPTLNAFSTRNATCDQQISQVASDPSAGKPDTWKTLLGCRVGPSCMGQVVHSFLSLPLVDTIFASSVANVLVDMAVNQGCPEDEILGGTMAPTTQEDTEVSSDSSNAGAIAGGALGGVAFVGLLAGAIWWYRTKKKKISNKTDLAPLTLSTAVFPDALAPSTKRKKNNERLTASQAQAIAAYQNDDMGLFPVGSVPPTNT